MSDATFWVQAPGAQLTVQERIFLKDCAEKAQQLNDNPVIVNIGVMWGASMHCFRAGAPHARLVGIDNDYYTYKAKKPELLRAEFITGDSNYVKFDGPVHLLFVDGGHDYETVLGDILNWVDKVPINFIVAFHDYKPKQHNLDMFPELKGVKRAVDEHFDGPARKHWLGIEGVDSIKAFLRRSR